MSDSPNSSPDKSDVERQASDWAIKKDRGLSIEEERAYLLWIEEDPRHEEAMELFQWGWGEFDRLAGMGIESGAEIDPDLLAPKSAARSRSLLRRVAISLIPIAAVLAIVFTLSRSDSSREGRESDFAPAVELLARIERMVLEDGSTVELNRGAVVEVEFSEAERRVRLLEGEANFTVAKEFERPFVVEASGVDVQAIGTQFNVRNDAETVDVIVSEGVVGLTTQGADSRSAIRTEETLLEVGARALVELSDKPTLSVTQLSVEEVEQELLWQPKLLDFEDTPLSEIVSEFNRRNQIQLILVDPDLEGLLMSNYFWSDNVEGFVRLLERNFGVSSEWESSERIALRGLE